MNPCYEIRSENTKASYYCSITHDRNISLNGDKLETAIAGGELELELDTKFGKVVLGIKLAELAVAEAVSLKPIVGTFKWEASDTLNPDWVGTYPEMAKLATFAMTIQGTVETTAKIDLDQFISDEKIKKQLGKFEADHKRLLQEKVKIDRKQKAINDLIKQEHELSDLQKQYRQLTDKVKKARGKGNKQKDLLAKKGRAFLEIRSKTAAFEQQLKAEGAKNLEQLKEQLDLKNKGLKDKLGLVEQHFNQIVDKADHQIKGVLKAAKKQVGKRIVSGIMKIIPGLNVISLAMDLYDAYTLYQDISAAYFESRSAVLSEDEFIEQDEELRALKYGTIPLEELPEILLVFFTAIGAGGKLAELKPEEAVQFENFFKEAFTDGINGVEFDQFLFRYGEVYEIEGSSIKTNSELLDSMIKEFENKDLIVQEGKVIESKDFNNSTTSSFFTQIKYSYVKGNLNEIGAIVELDGIGKDTNSLGETRRITIPNDNLIKLRVSKIPDKETVELRLISDYILEVENFKTYKISKNSKFIYNVYHRRFTRVKK